MAGSFAGAIGAAARSVSQLLAPFSRPPEEVTEAEDEGEDLFGALRMMHVQPRERPVARERTDWQAVQQSEVLEQMTDAEQHLFLIQLIRQKNMRAVEHILRLGRFRQGASVDDLWTAAWDASKPERTFMVLLDNARVRPSVEWFSRFAVEAASAGDTRRMEHAVAFVNTTITTEEWRHAASMDRRDVGSGLTYATAVSELKVLKCALTFSPAAAAACTHGHMSILEILGPQGWFHESGVLIARAACQRRPLRIDILQYLLEHGVYAHNLSWSDLDERTVAKLLLSIDRRYIDLLPDNIKERVLRQDEGLAAAVQRARRRLDRPPTEELGTTQPTREQLLQNLRSGGKRFAREYLDEGVPLFFPEKQAELGKPSEEFAFVTPEYLKEKKDAVPPT